MSDDTSKKTDGTEEAAQAQQDQGAALTVQGQYIKDFSFEVPNAPGIFADLMKAAPEIPTSVDININRLRENLYEVAIHLKIESRVAGKTAFIAELQYAGLFGVNVPAEHVQPVLTIECPRLLFPFARNIIADVTRDGGFPPLMLQPIDFVSLYRQRVAAQQQQGQGETGGEGTQTA